MQADLSLTPPPHTHTYTATRARLASLSYSSRRDLADDCTPFDFLSRRKYHLLKLAAGASKNAPSFKDSWADYTVHRRCGVEMLGMGVRASHLKPGFNRPIGVAVPSHHNIVLRLRRAGQYTADGPKKTAVHSDIIVADSYNNRVKLMKVRQGPRTEQGARRWESGEPAVVS